jgi:hypothetical protein
LRAWIATRRTPAAEIVSRKSGRTFSGILLIHADPAFHRHLDRARVDHRGHAIGDEAGPFHQDGAETPRLHPVRRAADIEVDLVVSDLCRDGRGARKLLGSDPPSCSATGCSAGSNPSRRSRSPWITAGAVTISV